MPKVVIFPPPSFFTLSTTMGATVRALAAPSELATTASLAAPTTIRETLQQRRKTLQAFGLLTLHGAKAVARARSSLATAAALHQAAPAWSPRQASSATPDMLILEAVGAIVVDSEFIDKDALESSFGATVVENFAIALKMPNDSPTAMGATISGSVPWHLQNINIDSARAQGLTGNGALVGILDTGIDPTHPEFAGKRIEFAEFDQGGQQIASTTRDMGTHGTHVSGLLAGATVGVAPQASLAVAAVLTFRNAQNQSVGCFAQILGGLNWLLQTDFQGPDQDPGVHVVNASFSCNLLDSFGRFFAPYNPYFYRRVADARQNEGTLLISAIGNNGLSGIDHHGSPGNYDLTLGIGAIDSQDAVAPFSDWGTVPEHGGLVKPDFCAPGDGVVSALPGGIYGQYRGTSMSAPLVTGTAALLIQRDPSLALTPDRLKSSLLSLTRPLPSDTTGRGGRGTLDLSGL